MRSRFAPTFPTPVDDTRHAVMAYFLLFGPPEESRSAIRPSTVFVHETRRVSLRGTAEREGREG